MRFLAYLSKLFLTTFRNYESHYLALIGRNDLFWQKRTSRHHLPGDNRRNGNGHFLQNKNDEKIRNLSRSAKYFQVQINS